jgi:hypothetical protein
MRPRLTMIMFGTFLARIIGLALASGILLGTTSAAAQTDYRKVVGGFSVYLGIVPAEIVKGHAQPHPEATMHGGAKTAGDTHHIMVSIIDDRSGEQVSDAAVEARVGEIGLASVKKKMEPMRIADSMTYGNYFPMIGRGPFQIDIEIRIQGEPGQLKTTFFFTPPNFEAPR